MNMAIARGKGMPPLNLKNNDRLYLNRETYVEIYHSTEIHLNQFFKCKILHILYCTSNEKEKHNMFIS